MTSRVLKTETDIDDLIALLRERKLPVTVTIASGRHRTSLQNRLQRKWCNEVAEQLEDVTPEYVRGYCKLTIGVPILRAENEAFCEKYDRLIKPFSYEQKLELMMEPMDFPVTRIMDTHQKTAYLDQVFKHWTEKGIVLTVPPQKHERMAEAAA